MPDQQGFDGFAALYEQMVDWDLRLRRELPFYRDLFGRYDVKTVLDAACGVGRHAVALAGWGLEVTGTDVDEDMIRQARLHVRQNNVRANLVTADFLSISQKAPGPFDLVMCVGNSLPALPDSAQRVGALTEFVRVLAPEGIVVLHLLNFHQLLDPVNEAMVPRVTSSRDGRVRFVKFFRPHAGRIEMCVEYKEKDGPRGRFVHELFPVGYRQLETEMASAGLEVREAYGDYAGEAFDERKSYDLILVARRS